MLDQRELLLLKELYLLKLLRKDLQQLCDRLSRRLAAETRADVGREAPGILCQRINCWRADSKPGSCELIHLTSSVTVDRTVLRAGARALSRRHLRGNAIALSAERCFA